MQAFTKTETRAINPPDPGRQHKLAHTVAGIAASLLCIVLLTPATSLQAQTRREKVKGVANFGRVTDKYFRGGEVTPEGVKNLALLGVRTIIDLREETDEKEAALCKELGITYLSFPMTTEDTPTQGHVEKVAELIAQATAPVYVHCSGGKHRTGTVCAYYRQKHQGHSAEKAWQEQQSYGFGPPEEHANLFMFIYGSTAIANKLQRVSASAEPPVTAKVETNGAAANPTAPASGVRSDVKAVNLSHPHGVLSATADYISTTQAIELTRGYGGAGETVRINLEYDTKNAAPVWKVLLASGIEYRLHAFTGALLGNKTKAEKLGVLTPLKQLSKYWTFQKVIAKAEKRMGEKVIEMELKSIKGRNRTFFEVMLADGVTLFFDATNGNQIHSF